MLLNTGIKPQVQTEIRQLAEKHNLNKVILFGSRARGDYWRASDIDLAVSGGDITRFALDVEEETSTLLSYDVVNLDEPVSPELLMRIQKEGVILYEKV
ncbi:MAG: nucleotidyltransferase domain-containing protein [Eubacteriales bacterium]|nr:nucleotidyltransferase domain-containing protein [Eubacteriales bacterium]